MAKRYVRKMKRTTEAVLMVMMCVVPFIVSAQEPPTVNPDVADLVRQHPDIPQIEELIAKSLAGTVATVVTVLQEVGSGESTTQTHRFVAGRIESISYSKDSGIASIVMIHNIKQIQTWKFQDNFWRPYNPDPEIELKVKNGL